MENCIIIHGGPLTDTPEEPHKLHSLYWQPWVKAELEKYNIPTFLPAMPNPWNPKYEEYKNIVDKLPISEASVLVGHSRGVAFLLRWLSDTKQKARKLIMVAPNLRTESSDSELQSFYDFEIDTSIKEMIPNRVVFTSENDDLENMESAKLIADKLDCRVINLPTHGHFITQEMGTNEYPLMGYLKKHVKKAVSENLKKEPLLCDPIDLEYQTLFRLTSYSIENIFENSSALQQMLERHTTQIGWRGLTTLDVETINKFKIKGGFIEEVVSEQKRLVTERLGKSILPLGKILNPSGVFAGEGWCIQKNNDQYTLEKLDQKSVPVIFKEVDTSIAQAFHNDLHYIHTPRIWKAYGFFLENEELPFSVLAIEPVDRTYKKNALLLFGFDPRHCIEFTRLYSWPGVPKNVTSAIFGAMFSHLRKHEPRLEAAISAFMPSYASGLSMLTGGFSTPILSKQGVHYFSHKNIGGSLAMEHITNRRKDVHIVSSRSKLPLLPTIELIAPIKHPRFESYLQIGTHMVEI